MLKEQPNRSTDPGNNTNNKYYLDTNKSLKSRLQMKFSNLCRGEDPPPAGQHPRRADQQPRPCQAPPGAGLVPRSEHPAV